MFHNQRRIVPRWKEWQPLPTHQLRLRSLIQIIGLNLGTQDLEGKMCGRMTEDHVNLISYYYTLHVTAMSAPFYTSDKVHDQTSKWTEINQCEWANTDVFGGIQSFVLRLWMHHGQEYSDEVIKVFGIHLTGLLYLGPHISAATLPKCPNSLIFLLPGGYFTIPEKSGSMAQTKPPTIVIAPTSEHLRHSYTLAAFTRLNRLQTEIRERQADTDVIKQKIMRGDHMSSDRRASVALRKILNRNKPKANQADVFHIKEEIELARYRVATLENEKRHKVERIAAARSKLDQLTYDNEVKESRTMENYRILQKAVHRHKEWLVVHVQRREAHLHARALLNFRIKQLISSIHCIYPVEQVGNKYTICGVYLPDSEDLHGLDDVQLSVALGFVAHAVIMVSVFLQVPLRYPVIHGGSRSHILDLITLKLPDSNRQFPLFCKGKDKLQFNYAVYLMNKNIAALRWLCGLATVDLRQTLANLAGLLNLAGAENMTPASPSSSTRDATPTVSVSSPAHTAPRYRIPAPSTSIGRHNLSCSLDNGLHELDHQQMHSRGGSESRLCLDNWHLHKFSDYDSDRPQVFFEDNTRKVRRVSFGQEACDDSCLGDDTLLADKSFELDNTFSNDNYGAGCGVDFSVIGIVDRRENQRLTHDHEVETGVVADSYPGNDNIFLFLEETDDPHYRENMLLENVLFDIPYRINSRKIEVLPGSEEQANKEVIEDAMPSAKISDSKEASKSNLASSSIEAVDREFKGIVDDCELSSEIERDASVPVGPVFDDDVSVRAEALTNQTSTFNMFRSRFGSRSTMGTTE